MNLSIRTLLFLLLALLCVTPLISPPIALALGLLFGLSFGTPFPERQGGWTKLLLQASVVGLGFGMNVARVLEVGGRGLVLATGSVVGTIMLGLLLNRLFGGDRVTGGLVTVGTAICGGSAIAATGPVLDADARQMSVALGVVFILNAVALFLFPLIGHALGMTQHEFGLWAAVAIHDTSSVVGAASEYGEEALQVGTTVKLTRALFIIPLVLVAARFYHRPVDDEKVKVKIPWFILLFVVALLLRTMIGDPEGVFSTTASAARQGLVLTIFLIGAGISREQLREVGVRPVLLGVVLWVVVAGVMVFVV